MNTLKTFALAGMITLMPVVAQAAEPIRIGVVIPLSGIFAEHGQQMQNGIKLFMKQHGNQVAGGTIVVPLSNPDFAPFVQRVKNEKPDAVFLFEPAPGGIASVKSFVERQ